MFRKACNAAEIEAHVEFLYCDLSALHTVTSFCDTLKTRLSSNAIPPLKLLVCNAGIKPTGKKRRITWEGFEKTFQVNYLSHFLMYTLLKSSLQDSGERGGSKVIFVGAKSGHTGPFSSTSMSDCESILRKLAKPQYVEKYVPDETYASSKLCNLMIASYIHSIEEEHGITSCSTNPGHILSTNLRRELAISGCMGKFVRLWDNSIDVGAALILHCCLTDCQDLKGQYFDGYDFKPLPTIGNDQVAQSELYKLSAKLCTMYLKHEEERKRRTDQDRSTAYTIRSFPPLPFLNFPIFRNTNFADSVSSNATGANTAQDEGDNDLAIQSQVSRMSF